MICVCVSQVSSEAWLLTLWTLSRILERGLARGSTVMAITPTSSASLYCCSTWRTWKSSCTTHTKAAPLLSLLPQRYLGVCQPDQTSAYAHRLLTSHVLCFIVPVCFYSNVSNRKCRYLKNLLNKVFVLYLPPLIATFDHSISVKYWNIFIYVLQYIICTLYKYDNSLSVCLSLCPSGYQDVLLHQPSDVPRLADQDPPGPDEGRNPLWSASGDRPPRLRSPFRGQEQQHPTYCKDTFKKPSSSLLVISMEANIFRWMNEWIDTWIGGWIHR